MLDRRSQKNSDFLWLLLFSKEWHFIKIPWKKKKWEHKLAISISNYLTTPKTFLVFKNVWKYMKQLTLLILLWVSLVQHNFLFLSRNKILQNIFKHLILYHFKFSFIPFLNSSGMDKALLLTLGKKAFLFSIA